MVIARAFKLVDPSQGLTPLSLRHQTPTLGAAWQCLWLFFYSFCSSSSLDERLNKGLPHPIARGARSSHPQTAFQVPTSATSHRARRSSHLKTLFSPFPSIGYRSVFAYLPRILLFFSERLLVRHTAWLPICLSLLTSHSAPRYARLTKLDLLPIASTILRHAINTCFL